MDGGGIAAQLEVQVRAWSRVIAGLGLVVATRAAHAQHYRLLVGLSGTHEMLLLDFSPCIPAEGSGCGGFLTRTIDAGTDSTFGGMPTAAIADSTSDGGRIVIVDRQLRLTTPTTAGDPSARERAIIDPARQPVAVAAASSQYAFAALRPTKAGAKAQVRMFDLATRTAVASLLIDGIPSGLAIAR